MQTEKLFYENCHLYDFSAKVIDCTPSERGYLVTLDATAFYPEGGGQACDSGTLGNANVLDVQERDGQILHLCDAPLALGTTVRGQIDIARRFDLMQQHSGEHIVSGLLCAKFGCHNVGFHVGKDCMEIDFDKPIPPEALAEIELLANEAVQKNLPIHCFYPTKEELPTIPYRSKKALAWPVRIVEIPDYDICACCGVHVATTGEIGLIKLLSCTKLRGGVRIELVCGMRAVTKMQEIFAQNLQVSQAFSAKIEQTGAAARRMNEALTQQKYLTGALQSKIFRMTAEKYENVGAVVHVEEGLSGGQLRELAEAIAEKCGGRVAVLTEADGGCNLCMLGDDLRAPIDALKAAFSTRGGGKPGSFQGSVAADAAQVASFLRGNVGQFV